MNKNNNGAINFQFNGTKFVPNDTAKGLFLFLVTQTIVTLIYQVCYMIGLVQSIWSYAFTLILDACFVYCVYYITRAKNYKFTEAIKVNKAPSIMQIFLCLIIAVVCMFGFSPITNLFMELLYSIGYTSVSSEILIPNVGYYLLYVLFICVIPALSEEILFRGLICSGLKKMGTVIAVFGSAFLFMIMHGSPDQTVHQFILGIVLALAFLVTNNLWVPILIHFFNNFIAITYSFIFQNILLGGVESEAVVESTEIYLSEYIISAVLYSLIAGSIIYLLLRVLSKHSEGKKEVEEVKIKQENPINYYVEDSDAYFGVEFAKEQGVAGEQVMQNTQNNSLDEALLLKDPEDRLNGSGKAMYVISIVWLVADWISALVLGLTAGL